nr:MAG TPA: hypothetical protein [Caudoviricetes sp.]
MGLVIKPNLTKILSDNFFIFPPLSKCTNYQGNFCKYLKIDFRRSNYVNLSSISFPFSFFACCLICLNDY